MAAKTRIYAVSRVGQAETTRLVRAPNAAQALRFVAADTLHVQVPTQDQLFALAAAGVNVEDSTATNDKEPAKWPSNSTT